MTIALPSIPALSFLNGMYAPLLQPLPTSTPFTYRSAATYASILEEMRAWIEYDLIPQLNAGNTQWDASLLSLQTQVDAALAAQKTSVDAAIAQAVADFANANVDITDPVIVAALNAPGSATLAWLGYAPAPSGGDDTATLLAVVNIAAHTTGYVRLQTGTYHANLDIFNSFNQPIIQGAGTKYTVIQATSKQTPAVKFNGGSGASAYGGLRDVTLIPAPGGGGVGLCYSGCNTVKSESILIAPNSAGEVFDEGLLFWNERPGDFTEFNTFEGDILGAKQPVHYKVSNGVESFHGSGLVGNSIVNCAGSNTGPVILIDDPGLVYNAPLYLHWFKSGPLQYLIQVNNHVGGRHMTMYGQITIEGDGGETSASLVRGPGASNNNMRVLFEGRIHWFSGNQGTLGELYLVRKTDHDGVSNTVGVAYEPWTSRTALKSGASDVIRTDIMSGGDSALLSITIVGPNYQKNYTYLFWKSPFNSGGVLTQLAAPFAADTGSVGETIVTAPTTSSSIQVSNANFTPSFTALATLNPLGGGLSTNNVQQYSN